MLQLTGLNSVSDDYGYCIAAGGDEGVCKMLHPRTPDAPADPWADAASGDIANMRPEEPSFFDDFANFFKSAGSTPTPPLPPGARVPAPPSRAGIPSSGISPKTIMIAAGLGLLGLFLYKRRTE
jgi:hypothetical protein